MIQPIVTADWCFCHCHGRSAALRSTRKGNCALCGKLHGEPRDVRHARPALPMLAVKKPLDFSHGR